MILYQLPLQFGKVLIMGMPAKKKAAAVSSSDDRKPRSMKSYAAFICAQPFDLPAKEITRAAQVIGYDVTSISAVAATRERYAHLNFDTGDPLTWFVKEFLASNVSQKAKTYTAGNSRGGLKNRDDDPKVSTIRALKKDQISAIVNTVLRDTTPLGEPDSKWGHLGDGTPKKKPGRKPRDSSRETLAGFRDQAHPMVIVPPAPQKTEAPPEPLPPAAQVAMARAEAEVAPVVATPEEPIAAPAVEVTADAAIEGTAVVRTSQFKSDEEEDDDVQLQELRDSFEVGDKVRVAHPAGNGTTFTREGRITRKETKFATVQLGSTHNKVAYKRLTLAPRIPGSGPRRANTNSDQAFTPPVNVNIVKEGDPIKPLKVVPPSFTQLKAVVALQAVPKPEPEPIPEVPQPALESAPEPAPEPLIAVAPVDASVPGVPSDSLALEQLFKDMLVWVEMGKPYIPVIPLYQAKRRSAAAEKADRIEQLKIELERLAAEREEDLKKSADFESIIAVMKQLGGEK